MLPYKYKIGSIEARNYVIEDYEIKKLGRMELVAHFNGAEFHIGTWKISSNSAELELQNKIPEMRDRDRWAMDEICKTTKTRLENELLQ